MTEPGAVVARLEERFAALAQLSAEGPGVTRLAYTELERQAHAQFRAWAETAGARVEDDAAGNTWAVIRDGEPYFLVGSHLDSVPHGGRYDGTVGVLVGLEVASLLPADFDVGVRVVAFAAEEGARFGKPNIGSALATDRLPVSALTEVRDADGVSVEEAASAVGLDPRATVAWAASPAVAAFIEVHIEQGRVLEHETSRLGVVDAVAGSARVRFAIAGRAEHSGTTPMSLRSDALAAAAELVLAAESIGRGSPGGVCTIGQIDVDPNSVTSIPGAVTGVADIRDVDPEDQHAAVGAFTSALQEICERRGVTHTVEVVSEHDPVVLSSWPRLALAAACAERGVSYRTMSSGAGHDAAIMARNVPAAMLFIPCRDGLSHTPDEACSVEDVALAGTVCADALVRLAADVAPPTSQGSEDVGHRVEEPRAGAQMPIDS
jgi:allantoate deiminase